MGPSGDCFTWCIASPLLQTVLKSLYSWNVGLILTSTSPKHAL